MPDRLADTHHHRFQGSTVEAVFGARRRQEGYAPGCSSAPLVRGLEYAGGVGRQRWEATTSGYVDDRAAPERAQGEHGLGIAGAPRLPENGAGPTNGFWRAADWLLCRDGKWRPVEPGTFPLAHGAPARVGRLRAYGNAVNGEATTAFILAARAAIGDYELC
ncbi:hypothetical protein F01_230161 [Burkholderia cenocepacia]|nr:hypothetical protein F01_230161 [Burkholderia cenocepacia]